MRGETRKRRKRLERAGWRVLLDRADPERGHRLLLDGPSGGLEVIAATGPRAWRRAELELLAGPSRRGAGGAGATVTG